MCQYIYIYIYIEHSYIAIYSSPLWNDMVAPDIVLSMH